MRAGPADFLSDEIKPDDDLRSVAKKAIASLCAVPGFEKAAAATIVVFCKQGNPRLFDRRVLERCSLDLLEVVRGGRDTVKAADWCETWFR